MIIRSTSDTHGYHRLIKKVDPCDLFIHSGDGTNNGTEEETEYLFSWLNDLPAEQVIYCPGNHDSHFANDWGDRNIRELEAEFPKIKILTHHHYEYKGLNFFVSSWTPEWGIYSFTKRREKVDEMFTKSHGPIDVLITHGPAWGILDNPSPGMDRAVGCVGLLNLIERTRPIVHLFGHIHQSRGVRKIGETIFFNSAFADWLDKAQKNRFRKPYANYVPNWIEIDENTRKVLGYGPLEQ